MKAKKLLCALIMTGVLFSALSPVFAISERVQTPANESEVSTRALETQWCYRTYNGRFQRRLWSITYGVWLTEWINC